MHNNRAARRPAMCNKLVTGVLAGIRSTHFTNKRFEPHTLKQRTIPVKGPSCCQNCAETVAVLHKLFTQLQEQLAVEHAVAAFCRAGFMPCCCRWWWHERNGALKPRWHCAAHAMGLVLTAWLRCSQVRQHALQQQRGVKTLRKRPHAVCPRETRRC